MIGQTISHFHIIEKPPTTSRKNGTPSGQVGEVGKSPTPACVPKGTSAGRSAVQRVGLIFSLPASEDSHWQAGIRRSGQSAGARSAQAEA
jgi:hypothetical protein